MKYAIAHCHCATGASYWEFISFEFDGNILDEVIYHIAEFNYKDARNIKYKSFGSERDKDKVSSAAAASNETVVLLNENLEDLTPEEWKINRSFLFSPEEIEKQKKELMKFIVE